jgi:hypothetical protein
VIPEPAVNPEPAAARLATARLAAFALAASLVASILVSRFVAPAWAPQGMDGDLVVLPLTGLALVLLLLSSRVRSFLLRRAPAPFLDPQGAGFAAVYLRASLSSLALLEAAGLLGCLLSFLSGAPRYGVVFGAACLLAMLTRWPREGELRRLLARRAPP